MTVFMNTLTRILKNKLLLLLVIILPPILMLPIGKNMRGDAFVLKVGIIDKDKTEYTDILSNAIKDRSSLIEMQAADPQTVVAGRKVDILLVIPKGFTKALLDGPNMSIKLYHRDKALNSVAIEQFIKSFITASSDIGKVAAGDMNSFNTAVLKFKDGSLSVIEKNSSKLGPYASYLTIGLYVMFMMMTTIAFTTIILTNKENRTLQRTLISPVSIKSYMLQMIGAFLIVSYFQAIVVLIILKLFMGVYFGVNAINMFVLFFAASIMSVSFGIAICGVSKSVIQACFVGLGICFPMTFVGGCWWKNEMTSGLINSIGRFTPIYWLMDSVEKLLDNKSLLSANFGILMVILFSVAFFLFGTWKKRDMAI